MDLTTHFIQNYSDFYVESRRASAEQYRYGNGSRTASMIAGIAASARRASATIERWARGTNVQVAEHRLPRLDSAR